MYDIWWKKALYWKQNAGTLCRENPGFVVLTCSGSAGLVLWLWIGDFRAITFVYVRHTVAIPRSMRLVIQSNEATKCAKTW